MAKLLQKRVLADLVTIGVETRVGLRPAAVDDYTAVLRAGGSLPPGVVFVDGDGTNWLESGHHRKAAHEKAGVTRMLCEIRQGTRWDAIKHGVEDNRRWQGERVTLADRKHNVKRVLQEQPGMSDRAIADLVGVSDCKGRTESVAAGGELLLFEKDLPIYEDICAQAASGGLPDLLLIVDSSGSMAWDPVAGNGPYDSLLRAVYSVLQFLEERQKAPYMRFAAINFSNQTVVTSWKDYADIRAIKQSLFKHQGGGTTLDCSAVSAVVNESNSPFLALMATDGQIGNAQAVADTIRKMVDRGHGFVLIQIGTANPMTELVRKLGVPVHLLSNSCELDGLCLEYARRTWGRGR